MKRNSSRTNPKRSLGGFTLVELIVVIAILAILSAVGAVAYTGYIEYAKKGQDRATVGEIMHALELANYNDPSLFEEGKPKTIYLTTDNGLISFDLEEALKDTFGDDLSSVKLTGNWDSDSAVDCSELSGILKNQALTDLLGKSDSQISQYLKADGTASFAGQMSDYWKEVENKVALAAQAGNKNAIQDIIDYSSENANSIVSKWNSKDYWTDEKGGYIDVARNLAFTSYVEQKYGDKYKDELDSLNSSTLTINTYDFSEELKEIRDEYISGEGSQAEIDARAFLGLMEAAGTLKNADGTFPTDEEIMPRLRSVVSATSAILDKSVDATTLSGKLPTTGKCVAITATKRNGIITFNDLGDLNPRKDSAGSGETGETCSESHTPTITVNPTTTEINVVICSKDEAYKSCTISEIDSADKHVVLTPFADNGDEFVDVSGTTITAKKAGNTTLTLKMTLQDPNWSEEDQYISVTVNVTVH